MRRPRVLLTRRKPHAVETALAARFDLDINRDDRPLSEGDLKAAMREYDALGATVSDRLTAAVLATPGARVRIIANFGVGYEHIDLAAARAAGIVVTNTPGVLTEATADLAILLMLMVTRRAGEGERELRAGRWTGWKPTHGMGRGLSGKTLGIVGFGRIGQATAERARAFGLRIAYTGRTRADPTVEAAYDATWQAELPELARQADILSLHCPATPATYHLIDATVLRELGPEGYLINTARGSIVDEAALAVALTSGEVAGAGLDVFENEPHVHPDLLSAPNAVFLPHLGSATVETREAMGRCMAENLIAFFDGLVPPNRLF